MSDVIKKADAFIEPDKGDLRFIFSKIKRLQELNRKIFSYLDPKLAEYCQVANSIENKLVLVVANGSVATQIRYLTADLLNYCKQEPALQHIKTIECKVRPSQTPVAARMAETPARHATLSPQAACVIKELAETMEDPVLKEILERMAGRET